MNEKYAIWGLPVTEVVEEVNEKLQRDGAVVVTAPPGAGKSTLLPLTLLDGITSDSGMKAASGIMAAGGMNASGRILMLEPRRIAARQIAERISEMLGEVVGGTVGYRMRFESRVSERTRIEIITEGILSRMLIDDPSLEGVSVVIFDEFHERSLDTDLALALTLGSRRIFRPDLKIVVLSATLQTEALCRYLHCRHVESQGRMFPVDIRYVSDIATPEEIASFVRKVHQSENGDILVFLPGEWEIRRCAEKLEGTLERTAVFPLYGMLSNEQQREAIAPCATGLRKVVLATPIAETSITIEGVRVVIDSGLCRRMVYDTSTALSRLETIRISRDMADQRAGRAGRTAPGICFRLWNAAIQDRMQASRLPEIADADLSSAALTAALWGESDLRKIEWLTPPSIANIYRAENLLKGLGAFDEDGHLTALGKKIGAFPCHPRIAGMLLHADTPYRRGLAADIAALLEEKDPLTDSGCDLCERIECLRQHRKSRSPWDRINRISEQYRRHIGRVPEDNSPVSPFETGALLAAAYPERVAMQVNEGRGVYMMANGEMVRIDRGDSLSSYQWVVVASLSSHQGGEGKVFVAAPADPSDLGFLVRKKENVCWNAKKGELTAALESRIGRLVISSQPITGNISERVVEAVCEAAPKDGLSMFNFDDAVGNLQRRVATAALWHPELNLPDLSSEAVLSSARQWVPFYIGTIGTHGTLGATVGKAAPLTGSAVTAAQLKKIDMCEVLWGMLSHEQQQALETIVPSHITVPTGSRIRVEYRQGADVPILRVRLQECFGLVDTPTVDNGRHPVLMELLSPGFKPVQLTSDLRSFWNDTYFEVRKELRRRYPKHSWPDDPLAAPAVRGVRIKIALLLVFLIIAPVLLSAADIYKASGDTLASETISEEAVSVSQDTIQNKALKEGEIEKNGWNFGPLPCVSYNSDLGLQYGICADIFNYKGVFPDYRQRFYVELSRYTKGQTLLHGQFDSRYLIPGIRTTFSASYQYDPMFLFYGLNGLEPYDRAISSNKETHTAYYNYKRSMVRVLTNFQGNIVGNLQWTGGISYWHYGLGDITNSDYDPEKTLFYKMREAGVFHGCEATGGSHFEFNAGVVFDTRDDKSAPSRGIWAETYLTGSPDVFNTGYNYLRLAAHWRHYVSLGTEKAVLAYHLAYQGIIAGQAPFYNQQNISTLYLLQTCTDGLGGINTVRGLVAQRLVGDSYAWANVELRIRLASFNLFNQSWYIATNPFFDTGMVTRLYKGNELSAYYGRGIEDLRADAVRLHNSAGIGLKIAMNRNFIVSAEYAHPFVLEDGDNTFYVALNYIF